MLRHNGMEDMETKHVISDYLAGAMSQAVYDKLDDGSYAGRIPACKGVLSFSKSLRDCEDELLSVLEDWVLIGLKLRHPLPVIGEIDLNKEPVREPVDAV